MIAFVAATANADGIRLDAKTHGSELQLTFTNTSNQPIKLTTRSEGGWDGYDWLSVELTENHRTRRLAFSPPQLVSAFVLHTVTLAPGASTSESLDLAVWAVRNGKPLSDGTYQLAATWKTDSPTRFVAHATTTLTIAAPVANPSSCTAAGELRLLAARGSNALVEVGIHNAGTTTLCVQAPAIGCATALASIFVVRGSAKPQAFFPVTRCTVTTIAPIVQLPPGSTLWEHSNIENVAGAELVYEMPKSPGIAKVWSGRISTPVIHAPLGAQ